MNARFAGLVVALCFSGHAIAAEGFSCKLMQSQRQSGSQGTAFDLVVSPNEAEQDRKVPPGWFLTSGRCTFEKHDGSDPDNDRREGLTDSAAGPGYHCYVHPWSTVYYIITLQAVICSGDGHGHEPRPNAPFSNVGLGGDTVAIARTMTFHQVPGQREKVQDPVPYSIRVCNLKGGADISVDLGTGNDTRLSWQRNNKFANQCLEVDQPRHVYFRTPDTVSVDEYGAYTLFAPGTFAKAARMGAPLAVPQDKHVKIGSFNPGSATCAKPAAGEPYDPAYVWCKLTDLAGGKNYRVCTDDGYSMQPAGYLEYPGSLMRIVLSPELMKKPDVGSNPNSYQLMPIAPKTCRDYFGVTTAAIIVLDNSWNEQSVSGFKYRWAEIPAP
jgi:hypothetical protein